MLASTGRAGLRCKPVFPSKQSDKPGTPSPHEADLLTKTDRQTMRARCLTNIAQVGITTLRAYADRATLHY